MSANMRRPSGHRFKKALATSILWFLGRGFSATAARDTRIQSEFREWPDGTRIVLKIMPHGPAISLARNGNRLKFLGFRDSDNPAIAISFKNLDAAILVLTAQLSSAHAFAEHRFIVRGDISLAMSVVRCLVLVEAYLFPRFIAKKIIQRIPKKQVSSLRIYLATLFGT